MDLTKYYPDIAAKYPAYVTKRELCEICHICPKTAYNLEQQGEIPYTIEQNHLIRSHKIKLTDILAYLYRRECRQEADSPYICAMRTFYDEHLSPYSDLLSVKDIQQITGFSSSAIVRWISTGILKAFQPGKQYTVPKDFMLDFLISPYYRRIRRKTPLQKELMDTFERLWQEKGGEGCGTGIQVSLFAESVPRNSPKRAIPHYLSYQQTHSSLSAAIRSGSLRTEWEKDPELHHKDERHSSLP